MNEMAKTIGLLKKEELDLLQGKGIDIGCGIQTVRPDAQRFDQEEGDANVITKHILSYDSYDYVFSSHCLEHMHDPIATFSDWWKLVKPGGIMFIIVPDEDLYEQGFWPSLFNPDHKATFTISKQCSWSPVSLNLLDMARALKNAEIISIRLQDSHYKRIYQTHGYWSRKIAQIVVPRRWQVISKWPFLLPLFDWICLFFHFPIDQTASIALAQNILIVKKTPT
jgi:SAM-dependent methyltransferase